MDLSQFATPGTARAAGLPGPITRSLDRSSVLGEGLEDYQSLES